MRQRSNLIILFGIAFLLVGGAIVYLIVNDDDASGVASGDVDKVSILVAKDDIPANTVGSDALEQGLVETKEVAVGAQPAAAITSPSLLQNQIFAIGVSKGTTISTTHLATRSLSNIEVPEGYDGVAISVAYTNGGAGYIAPGDTVNVYGVYGSADSVDAGLTVVEGSAGTLPRSELALTNVTVLDVSSQQTTSVQAAANSTVEGEVAGRQAGGGALTYLLALKHGDIERIVQLTTFADIYLSLTSEDAPNAPDTPGIDGSSVNAPVSSASAQPAA